MTRAEIIAELRRSATHDRYPWAFVQSFAFEGACEFKRGEKEALCDLSDKNCRTFFLLCAHALEDEC